MTTEFSPQVPSLRRPKKGEELTLLIESLDSKGRGRVRMQGNEEVPAWEISVRGALPGDEVLVKVIKRRRQRLEGLLLEVITPSPERIAPICQHFGTCGGCSWQHLEYEAQLKALQIQVMNALAMAGIETTVASTIGGNPAFRYRNKMEYTFGDRRWVLADEPEGAPKNFAVGMHVPRRWDRVLDIYECHLQPHIGDTILNSIRELSKARGLSAWNPHAHEGLLRHVVFRFSQNHSMLMVNLVTSEAAPELIEPLIAELKDRHPEITTFVQSITSRLSSVAIGEQEIVHFGSGEIVETVLDTQFRVSAKSFFQTNTTQAERLAQTCIDLAELKPGDVVYDLYCGAGFLSLLMAPHVKSVIGLEVVEEAIADARKNADLNDISNAEFLAGDVLELLSSGDRPLACDLCVVDPPRVGLHKKVITAIREFAPKRLIYVSCNVHSAAPQIAELCQDDLYRVDAVQPVDLFPHTPHVECVFRLIRTN